MTNISFENFILSFGHGTKEEKKNILRDHPDKKVFMDLTCFDPAEFYQEFPQLCGAFSALFCDENKKVEIHFREKNQRVTDKFKELGFTLIETNIVSCGFIFPRTVVQIINEAYFALEENVASKEDINRAMKFGVNYPKGPFEWARDREEVVLLLLQELWHKTNDARYRPCPLLAS